MVRDPSTSRSVTESFDTTLQSLLLDVHAPVRTVCVRAARTAPWYDEDFRRKKKETRRLEKLYRRNKIKMMKSCGKLSSTVNGSSSNRNSDSTGLQQIDSCRGDSKALWSKLRVQMSAPSHQNSSHFCADDFAAFFTSSVDKLRASASSASPPVIKTQLVTTPLSSFESVSVEEVSRLLSRTSIKHCSLDPVPTWLVKRASKFRRSCSSTE